MFSRLRRSLRRKKVFYCVSCGRVHKETANCDYENISVLDFIPGGGPSSGSGSASSPPARRELDLSSLLSHSHRHEDSYYCHSHEPSLVHSEAVPLGSASSESSVVHGHCSDLQNDSYCGGYGGRNNHQPFWRAKHIEVRGSNMKYLAIDAV